MKWNFAAEKNRLPLTAQNHDLIHYKNTEEIELIRKANLLVSATLAHVATLIKPGISLIRWGVLVVVDLICIDPMV